MPQISSLSQAECWNNREIYTEVYILIDLCSEEARVIISTGRTKFYPVTIFLFAYFQDGRQSLGLNLWNHIYLRLLVKIWLSWSRFFLYKKKNMSFFIKLNDITELMTF